MVGMPGFWPGFLALDWRTGGGVGGTRVVGGEGLGGLEGEKYSFTVYSNPCIKNIIYLKSNILIIPYIKTSIIY